MATFASKKWGKRAFYCDSCGYEFRKAWIEPMFMIRDFIEKDHEWYHNAATDEKHPLVQAWTEWERDRIIKLIKDDYAEVAKRHGYQFLPEQIEWLENLIKGEHK